MIAPLLLAGINLLFLAARWQGTVAIPYLFSACAQLAYLVSGARCTAG